MITLNLLPKSEKAILRRSFYRMVFRAYATTFVILCITYAGSLYAAQNLLEKHITQLQSDIQSAAQGTTINQGGSIQDNIKKINALLLSYSTVQQNFFPWSHTVAGIVKRMPAGISITRLTIDSELRTVLLEGVAATRPNLITLRDVLDATPYFQSAKSPVSDLTERSNIPFQVTATLMPSFWTITDETL
ncbi:MAG: PilN domain-containing protein [Patescibacteria group bacterium]|jgi:Tfp pilus assembly protein PilN